MYNRRFRAPNVKKASHGGVIDSEATQETEVEASGSYSGSKETWGLLPPGQMELFVPCPDDQLNGEAGVRDGEEKGGGC